MCGFSCLHFTQFTVLNLELGFGQSFKSMRRYPAVCNTELCYPACDVSEWLVFRKLFAFFLHVILFHFPCFGKNIFSKHKRPRGGVLRAVDIIFKVSHSQSYFFWHVKRSRFVKPLFLVEPSVTNHDHDLTKRTWSGGIWCRNEQKVRLGINRSISPCYSAVPKFGQVSMTVVVVSGCWLDIAGYHSIVDKAPWARIISHKNNIQ